MAGRLASQPLIPEKSKIQRIWLCYYSPYTGVADADIWYNTISCDAHVTLRNVPSLARPCCFPAARDLLPFERLHDVAALAVISYYAAIVTSVCCDNHAVSKQMSYSSELAVVVHVARSCCNLQPQIHMLIQHNSFLICNRCSLLCLHCNDFPMVMVVA